MNDTPRHQLNRRQLLATTLAATAAATSSTSTIAAPNANRIGFVDDNLDNFHSRTYLRILRSDLKDRGFVVTGATALQAKQSRQWAEANELPYFDSIERLNEAVDFFAVLAPSNPQTHLGLCERVLPLGKTTFVDKTFAPDAITAKKIFDLADKHQVGVQTSSALRYTAVQEHVAEAGRETLRHMITWGGGSNFDEYVIHPLELAISCLGHEVESVMRRGGEPHSQLLLNFSDGRTAVVNVYTNSRTPYAASVTTAKETRYIAVDTKRLFVNAAAGMLDFFAAEKPLIDRRETMAVLRVIDAARASETRQKFVKV